LLAIGAILAGTYKMESKAINPEPTPSPTRDRDQEISIAASYSGPLPPAREFASYDKAVPVPDRDDSEDQ